jgi:SAM-dependent methyltransferase
MTARGAIRARLASVRNRGSDRTSVAHENSQRGTATWRIEQAPPLAVEGYCSGVSVHAGESLGLHVSTDPAAAYTLSVYRLGYYAGLGARLIVGLAAGEWRQGQERPIPVPDPRTGLVRAQWPITDYIQTGEDWTSGQYLAVLGLVDGEHAGAGSYVPFVVRRRRGLSPAPALVQMPATTAQAHNHWGGSRIAPTEHIAAASIVSFDRPLVPLELADLSARWPLWWDLPLLRFLEREGVELEYAADVDIHREPQRLLEHRLVILSGDGAYWSATIRSAFDAAVRRGVNVACMGPATGTRRITYEDDERTIVSGSAWGDSWLARTGLRPGPSDSDSESDVDAIRLQAASGAIVFGASSLPYSSGLDDGIPPGQADARLQRAMRNELTDLLCDRRIDERTVVEQELALPSEQPGESARLASSVEIPIKASASVVWPALAEALVSWRSRVSVAVASWDHNFGGDIDAYLEAGHSALWIIARALAGAGIAEPETILDLPCGTGRVTRALRAAWPAAQLVAADTSAPAIDFCEANFDAEPWRLDSSLHFDGEPHRDRYDLVWCSTLLSQTPPSQMNRCLTSLLGLVRPNGVLVASYHGRDSANRFRGETDPGLRGLADSLASRGTGFRARDDGSGLGIAVLSPNWLAANITSHRGAMLLSLTERGWLDHLDVVAVMRKDIHHPHGNIEFR